MENAMNSDLLHDFTLDARGILVAEVNDQLEGVYGWLDNGALRAGQQLPGRREAARVPRDPPAPGNPNDRRTCGRADARRRARKLAKETAFTWLNRLVAFKMMEARKLIRQTISKGVDSNGFKRWVTEPGNEGHYGEFDKGDLPTNEFGEGPRRRPTAISCWPNALIWPRRSVSSLIPTTSPAV